MLTCMSNLMQLSPVEIVIVWILYSTDNKTKCWSKPTVSCIKMPNQLICQELNYQCDLKLNPFMHNMAILVLFWKTYSAFSNVIRPNETCKIQNILFWNCSYKMFTKHDGKTSSETFFIHERFVERRLVIQIGSY